MRQTKNVNKVCDMYRFATFICMTGIVLFQISFGFLRRNVAHDRVFSSRHLGNGVGWLPPQSTSDTW